MVTIAALQLDDLTKVFPGSTLESISGGAGLVTVPDVSLPEGWNKRTTTIWFLVPVGYPSATPDCFYADSDLRLVNAAMPGSSGMQEIPNVGGGPRLWFSWHVSGWQPTRDTLLTYVRVIRDRLNRPQ